MGPIFETLDLAQRWFETEVNSASDNPLIDDEGGLHMGGNFYGGHLSHGMDYLKICVSHMADLIDRQLMTLMDDKSNRGLPPNLVNWPGIKPEDRFLHHGLKGLHQAVSAITSEILARTMPNGVFSRSSESHNQDKVSLGMSAAVQCSQMVAPLQTITAMYLTCLCQALDLRGLKLKGSRSRELYALVRSHIAFVTHDQALGERVRELTATLALQAQTSTSQQEMAQ
jgi:histidine ammonia-lyase